MNTKIDFENYIFKNKNKLKISSKDIKKGDVFLSLKGKNTHGNKFITSSIKKGARYCITDNKNYKKNNKVILVKNVFLYLTSLANRKRDLYKGKVIGITGSAGKTTLKETIVYFLKKKHKISYSQKSYNNKLGVLISLLNLNLESTFAIFEIGTNNFGEIKELTKIVRPSEIFITNIQSTHLEYFITKKNIAKEKSDIFNSKYNNERKKLYLNITSYEENIILKRARQEKKLKIIRIDKNSKKYFIKNIVNVKNLSKVTFHINKKNITINKKNPAIFRLTNLLFCYAFFNENHLKIEDVTNNQKNLKPVSGRGLNHRIFLNKKIISIIDESYNSNPDTLLQSIEYINKLKISNNKKILILGDMNELGKNSTKIHLDILKRIDLASYKFIILCGKILRRSINNFINPSNLFIYLENKNKIMKFLNKSIHNNDIIMIKCSNSTEINQFAKVLLKRSNIH